MIGIGQARPVGRARQIRERIGRVGQAQPVRPHRPQGGRNPRNPNPIPFNYASNQAVTEARNTRDQTLAGLNTKGFATQQSYGLEGPYADPTTNPYSQAAQLQRSYEQARRGNVNSMAAGGQLYSGALHNANTAIRGDYDQKLDSLWKDYTADKYELDQDRLEAKNTFRGVVGDAKLEAISEALKEDPEAQASPRNRRQRQIRNRVNRNRNQSASLAPRSRGQTRRMHGR